MSFSHDGYVDSLLARRTIEGQILTVPGFADLDESRQAQIIARLQQEDRGNTGGFGPDPGVLAQALQSLTPAPPTDDELLIDDQLNARKARQALEAEGCPACYPPELELPFYDIPEDYQSIISYWQLSSSRHNVELLAQHRDWVRFRGFQERVRDNCRKKKKLFTVYSAHVHKRRKRLGLGGSVVLRFDLDAEDRRVENWIEFQAFHIQFYMEKLEQDLDIQTQEKENLRRRANASDLTVARRATELLQRNQPAWDHQERKLEAEKEFLKWTEQQRIVMNKRPASVLRTLQGRSLRARRRQPLRQMEKDTAQPLMPPRRACGERIGGYMTRVGRISRPPVRWVPS